MKLSVAVITYNEEANIGRFLDTLQNLADEIIIVDSFSTDRTQEIARKYPKVVWIPQHFLGYGPQKNYALEKCSGEWILFLDADEIPDKTLINSIKNVIAENPKQDVYTVAFNNIFLGKTVKYGGWGNVSRERLFRKGTAKYSDDLVHETFLTKSIPQHLEGRINHFTYKNIHHHIEKSNRYTTMMAEKLYSSGKKSSGFKIVFSPFFIFIKNYAFRLGFLDGTAGFYAAVTAAFYTFMKYMKLYELTHKS